MPLTDTERRILRRRVLGLRRALGAFDRVAGDVALSTMKTNERRAVRDAAALAELLDRITERGHHAEAEE